MIEGGFTHPNAGGQGSVGMWELIDTMTETNLRTKRVHWSEHGSTNRSRYDVPKRTFISMDANRSDTMVMLWHHTGIPNLFYREELIDMLRSGFVPTGYTHWGFIKPPHGQDWVSEEDLAIFRDAVRDGKTEEGPTDAAAEEKDPD